MASGVSAVTRASNHGNAPPGKSWRAALPGTPQPPTGELPGHGGSAFCRVLKSGASITMPANAGKLKPKRGGKVGASVRAADEFGRVAKDAAAGGHDQIRPRRGVDPVRDASMRWHAMYTDEHRGRTYRGGQRRDRAPRTETCSRCSAPGCGPTRCHKRSARRRAGRMRMRRCGRRRYLPLGAWSNPQPPTRTTTCRGCLWMPG